MVTGLENSMSSAHLHGLESAVQIVAPFPGLLPWAVLFAPLIAFLAIVFLTRKSRLWSASLAIGGLGVSLLCTLSIFLKFLSQSPEAAFQFSLPWVELPGLTLEFGLLINPLAVLMSLVVTGVGLMIFIYSVGYMAEEPGFTRYFAYLSLFAFSMIGIVLANNFVTLFMFWELVGASSYLLIGYWYDRPKAAEAGKKAFLVNRIADFGFLVGILMLWSFSGAGGTDKTLNISELAVRTQEIIANDAGSAEIFGVIGVLIFCGVIGKSAQFPLHIWLPDAMEGPTPVSALIHAATMVAAGVYLLCRAFFIFSGTPQLLAAISVLGGFTAFFAATMALTENDIKRVLAYSTLSQLGYMVMALGLGGYTAGMYHLTTHAFFKALLFMGAGCVIHALHTNDIRQMGGLARTMPVTTLLFLTGSLALCGIFPFSGFWSKDEILALAFSRNRPLWILGTATAGMTAFYMGRVFSVAFLRPHSPDSSHVHSVQGHDASSTRDAHEAPPIMTVPLIPLAILSCIGGFLGIPHFLPHVGEVHGEFNLTVAVISSLAALTGLGLAYGVYCRGYRPGDRLKESFVWVNHLLARKYYVDELYSWINRNVQQRLAIFLATFERIVIIGLWANGIAKVTGVCGDLLRRTQTGKVQGYALTLLVGLSLLIFAAWQWAP